MHIKPTKNKVEQTNEPYETSTLPADAEILKVAGLPLTIG